MRAIAPAKKTTVADYLKAAPAKVRPSLTKLRKAIKAAAPGAVEAMSYGIVGVKLDGKIVAYFGYWKTHVSIYGIQVGDLEKHAPALKAFLVSKGTIKFPIDAPLPLGLVTKVVKARAAEIAKGTRPGSGAASRTPR